MSRRKSARLSTSLTFSIIALLVLLIAAPRVSTQSSGNAKKYLKKLRQATFRSIERFVDPVTGLPHDRLDLVTLDIAPQLALTRTCLATTAKSQGATIDATTCANECKRSGELGLKISYSTPPGNFASYNIEATSSFNAASATFLELWAKGENGGERFEVVLWSDRAGGFPGRPASALLSGDRKWKRHRIPVGDFSSFVDLSKLFRLSIGFNDAIHPAGVIFLDHIRFVDANGNPVYLALNEDTNVTNIGLYMACLVGAVQSGIEESSSAASKLSRTLASIEALEKFHGFPQTHNHVASLKPALGDRCISFVDLGYLAAGLILVRQQFPELAARASALLAAMDWGWFYDEAFGLPHGCRFPDGSTSSFHYDFFAADSMLAHFISIGADEMPPASFNNLNRTGVAPRCATRSFFTPGWTGGGLFMQFFPAIFIDNAGTLLRQSACAFVEDQICLYNRLGAPAWGSSAVGVPPFSCQYCGFDCDRDDLLTAHASVLAVDCVGRSALVQNLRSLESLGTRPLASDGTGSFDLGFRSAVNWRTREVSSNQLILEQAMLFLSLCNDLKDDSIRKLFCRDPIASARGLIPEFAATCSTSTSN
jgi:hypothetical protein